MTSPGQNLPSDEEVSQWLLATSQGDHKAFSRLLRLYWNKVYSQALTYVKSAERAEEITQDVFIKIWSAREKLGEVQRFSDYLFIVSRNELISTLRKKRMEAGPLSDALEDVLMRPDDQVQYKELHNKILALIDRLPPARKRVFILSRLEGKSYEEIGTLLGISRNGVKDHVVRALNFLRTHFFLQEQIKVIVLLAGMFLIK